MIRIEKIDKYFNKHKKSQIHVINNTSIQFEEKGLVALLGPSGCGKTTLLNVIGGLDKVKKGKIYINGKKITKRFQNRVDKIRNLNIGYIFQDYKLLEELSVYENVSIALKMIGIKDKKEIEKRVTYVLEKVGMLRYKKRPCAMLSGGERQRVGIARAIVKNPNIIIADEPTGNLDSKNSIEIMNIIKSISKEKLVILVTHESNLAKFYASRIIELEDGKIVNDYTNENQEELEYEIDNTIYLKDYTYQKNINGINIYSNKESNLILNIIVSNDNIYIETKDNKKIEVIDETSSIEIKNEHYKNITKEEIEKYKFDYDKITSNHKIRYSSIFNPITFITNGFKKIFEYSLLKKILLIGFFLSGIFIMYASSSILSSITIDDSKFVNINKEYLTIELNNIKLDDYINYENNLNAEYLIPGDSTVKMNLKYDLFYQGSQFIIPLEGSLSSLEMINNSSLIDGRWPENENEIVIDMMIINNSFKNDLTKMVGLTKKEDFLEKNIYINNMNNLKVVGIVNLNSPSIYVYKNKIINILYHLDDNGDDIVFNTTNQDESKEYDDYILYTDRVELKEGRWPESDYETIVDISHKEEMKLNKEINKTINERKLTVVGYYTSKESTDTYLVNNNMIKILLIKNSSDISVYSLNKENTIKKAREQYNLNIKDSYTISKERYIKTQKEKIKSSVINSSIIIIISLIETFLMIRSSFLSKTKEVGIYRAIGVKKKDIYIMFSGEIIAITTLASVPGILLCAYIIKLLSNVNYIGEYISINLFIVVLCIVIIYIFNLIAGLIPVFNTIRKRPAEILSRTDVQ